MSPTEVLELAGKFEELRQRIAQAAILYELYVVVSQRLTDDQPYEPLAQQLWDDRSVA